MRPMLPDQSSCPPSTTASPLQAWLFAILALTLGYAMMSLSPIEVSDEGFHGPQVWSFFSNDNGLVPQLTVPPTYHFIIGKLLRLIDYYTVDMVRLLSTLIGALSLVGIGALSRHYHGRLGDTRMLQVLMMPFAFPHFVMIYTDAWALGAVIGMLALCLRERHLLAALMAVFAMALRPTAVIWLGFAVVLTSLSPMVATDWRSQARKLWPYLIPIAVFVAFVVWNGGIALGDKSSHKLGINLTNLYMFLICAWILLLPWNIEAAPRVYALLHRPAVLALLVAGFFLYMATFSVTHPYNHPNMSDFLHNQALAWFTGSRVVRALAYIPLAWMVLTLAATRLAERRLYLLYPVIIASVCLHPLIEPRYYIPGLAMLIILRPAQSPRTEALLLLLYIPASAAILRFTAATEYFL